MGGYTFGEIAFLLSLSFGGRDGEDIDVGTFRSQLANVTPDGDFAPAAPAELDPIPTYVRHTEVLRARARVEQANDRVARAAEESLALELRLMGFSEAAIAEQLGVSQPTAHRRWRALIEEIALELGGVVQLPEDRQSSVPACLRCGQRPRARWLAVRVKVYGGWRQLRPERQASLCADCTPEDRRHLLVQGGE